MADKEIEKTPTQIESERVTLLLQQLDLEEKLENASKRRALAAQRQMSAEASERTLAENRAQQRMRAQMCPHRKGGKNIEGLDNGNSPDFAVIKHTLSHGGVIIVCQRCQNIWEAPVPPKVAGMDKKSAEYKTLVAAYKAELVEYQRALNFPTNNEPSGTRLFAVERTAA